MDVREIEMGDRAGSPKKENGGVSQQFQFRSFSVDGNTRCDLSKTQYSYERQNSINNSKDYNDLKDRKDLDHQNTRSNLEIHNNTLDKASEDNLKCNVEATAYHVNEKINISESQKLLGKDINLIKVSKMTDPGFIGRETVYEEKECFEKTEGNGGSNRRSRACLYRITACCVALLLCCVGLLIFVYIKVSNETVEEEEEALALTQAISHHEVNVAGSFKINQTHLHVYKRVKWLRDEHSQIIPSNVDDCLTIPHAGKYLVFSRFTFNILPSVDTLSITHYFKLKSSDGKLKDGGFKRKYVSVLENRLRTPVDVKANRELRKPSVFIEFFTLDANDQVCPNVSNPDLLYQSKMDNDVNIVQV